MARPLVFCALLGVPLAAGAALFRKSALLAADLSPEDPLNRWAVQAASEMESKYTCNVSALLPRFEHESWAQADDSWGKDFLLPPNTHLLLYGTSQVRAVRQVLVSMARYQGKYERSRLVDISDHCGSGSGSASNFLDRVLTEAALENLTCVPGTCALCGIQKQKCKHADHTVDYFEGNSTVTTVTDMAQYQKAAHLNRLKGLITTHTPAFTNAYFWAPNDESYFDMQCAKLAVSRDPRTVQKLTEAFQGGTQALCDLDEAECRDNSPFFTMVQELVPEGGYLGRPGKRSTELTEMSGYFETRQDKHWCNVVCVEGDPTKCAPTSGVPLAWEVLWSAKVLRLASPANTVATGPAAPAASAAEQEAAGVADPEVAEQEAAVAAVNPGDALKQAMEVAQAEQEALEAKAEATEQAERDEVAAEKEAYDKAAAAAEAAEAEAAEKETASAAAAEAAAVAVAKQEAAAEAEKAASAAEKKSLSRKAEDAQAGAAVKVANAEARAA